MHIQYLILLFHMNEAFSGQLSLAFCWNQKTLVNKPDKVAVLSGFNDWKWNRRYLMWSEPTARALNIGALHLISFSFLLLLNSPPSLCFVAVDAALCLWLWIMCQYPHSCCGYIGGIRYGCVYLDTGNMPASLSSVRLMLMAPTRIDFHTDTLIVFVCQAGMCMSIVTRTISMDTWLETLVQLVSFQLHWRATFRANWARGTRNKNGSLFMVAVEGH